MKKSTILMGRLTITEEVKSGVPTGNWRIELPPALGPNGRRKRWFGKSEQEG